LLRWFCNYFSIATKKKRRFSFFFLKCVLKKNEDDTFSQFSICVLYATKEYSKKLLDHWRNFEQEILVSKPPRPIWKFPLHFRWISKQIWHLGIFFYDLQIDQKSAPPPPIFAHRVFWKIPSVQNFLFNNKKHCPQKVKWFT